MMNFQKMMQQAQQMQMKMQELQDKLSDIEIVAESGGGMVQVTMNGKGEMRALSIDPSLMSADDKETTEDLIIAAINNANIAKDERIKEETQSMMKEMGLPEGTQLPGM